jgi:hypothetical protein
VKGTVIVCTKHKRGLIEVTSHSYLITFDHVTQSIRMSSGTSWNVRRSNCTFVIVAIPHMSPGMIVQSGISLPEICHDVPIGAVGNESGKPSVTLVKFTIKNFVEIDFIHEEKI